MPNDLRDPLPAHESLSTLFAIYGTASRAPQLTRSGCERLAADLHCHQIPPEGHGDPYILRYGAADMKDGSHVYLQNILRSDEERELHSHPAPARGILLVGSYREERRFPDPRSRTGYGIAVSDYGPGDVNVLSPETFHRLDILNEESVWTIFIMGPKIVRPAGEASWSFWDRDTGKVTGYREFIQAKGYEAVSTPQDLATAPQILLAAAE